MIDEKKIDLIVRNRLNGYLEAASEQYPVIGEMFKDMPTLQLLMMSVAAKGVEWYLQSLWHDASEEPNKEGAYILMRHTDGSCECFRYTGFCDVTWEEERKRLKWWKCWCYLSDILPQKGGEE